MDSCNLPIAISAAACVIASQVKDTAELVMLATVLSQLSSTLGTIASQRELCKGKVNEVSVLPTE